jgi:hypothetical protein
VTTLILVVMLVLPLAVTYTTGTFEALGSFLCNHVHMKYFRSFEDLAYDLMPVTYLI